MVVRTERLARLRDRLVHFCEWLSVTMFAALFATFIAQVFWRYILRDPLVWTLEVAGLLFVTLSLFTAATQMPLKEHVSFDLVMDILPKRVAGPVRGISLTIFAVVMLSSVPDTISVLEWMYKERTFAVKFNLGHLFVLMIGFVVIFAGRALSSAYANLRPGDDPEDG